MADLSQSVPGWEWLLTTLGYTEFQRWSEGISWTLGGTYVVIEQAPRDDRHERRGAGLSHLAFHAGEQVRVDEFWAAASDHGWSRLYEERYPWAGGAPDDTGPGHYAAFLENSERFKVELVADDLT